MRHCGAIAGCRDERAHAHRGHCVDDTAIDPVDIAVDLEMALERSRHQLDVDQPFHGRDCVPPRHDQAQREAVIARQRSVVHLPGEDRFATPRDVDRQAALERHDATLRYRAAVRPGEDALDRIAAHAGRLEHVGKASTGEHGRADRAEVPLRAGRGRIEQQAAVAGALERDAPLDARQCAERVHVQLERLRRGTVDAQTERALRDHRRNEVVANVERLGGRTRRAQRGERRLRVPGIDGYGTKHGHRGSGYQPVPSQYRAHAADEATRGPIPLRGRQRVSACFLERVRRLDAQGSARGHEARAQAHEQHDD